MNLVGAAFELDATTLQATFYGPGLFAGNMTVNGTLIMTPAASVTPASNGQLVIQATSNTSLTFKYKGSDGTVRSASLTLA
jgi:hypothetical protein